MPCITPFVPCISKAITSDVLILASVIVTPLVKSIVMSSPCTVPTAPEGTSFEAMDNYQVKLMQLLKKLTYQK